MTVPPPPPPRGYTPHYPPPDYAQQVAAYPAARFEAAPLPSQPVVLERPGAGVIVCGVGFVLALLGVLALPWARKTSYFDVYDLVDHHGDSLDGATVVSVVLTIPLTLFTGLLAVLATISRAVARWSSAVLSLLAGLFYIGLVVWVETGHVGSEQSRQDHEGAIYGVAVLGGALILLAVGIVFEKSAWLARSLIALLALIALVLHIAAVADLFDSSDASPGVGIWLTGIGYAAIAVGVLLPYRRTSRGT